jgi:hypothetical protein
MLWKLYLRNGIAYVPTVAKTDAGFYLDVEPVRSVSASDSIALQNAIKQSIDLGNLIRPTPTRAAFPKPVVLAHAKVGSWSQFEKGAEYWGILEKDGNYQIKPGRKRPDRGWEDDPNRIESLEGATVEVVAHRVAALVKNALENTQSRSLKI